MTPEEHLRAIERGVVEADLRLMAESIGELHLQWEQLSDAMRSDVLKLEAIFLSLLAARVRDGGKSRSKGPVSTENS